MRLDIFALEAYWSQVLQKTVWLMPVGEEALLMQLGFTLHGYDRGFVIAIPPSHPPWREKMWLRRRELRNSHVTLYQNGWSPQAPLRVAVDYEEC